MRVENPTRPEAWRVIGDPGQPAFENGWANWGAPHALAAFFKDLSGVVHLRGFLYSPSSLGASAFTLPVGYRSADIENFALIGNNVMARVQLNTDGTLQFLAPTNTLNWVSICGVSYRADQ